MLLFEDNEPYHIRPSDLVLLPDPEIKAQVEMMYLIHNRFPSESVLGQIGTKDARHFYDTVRHEQEPMRFLMQRTLARVHELSIVESSKGRYHAYFRLNARVDVQTGMSLNRGLRTALGGDPACLRIGGAGISVPIPGLPRARRYGEVSKSLAIPQEGFLGQSAIAPVGNEFIDECS